MNKLRKGFAVAALALTAFAFQGNSTTPTPDLRPIGPCLCLDVYDPVCTFDGKKFGNACYAQCAGYRAGQYTSCEITE
ncbi:MAG TPA: hypothetical protein DCE41_27760 [Cytophagales bacterium]|nr:hypothetical protein [Cytophagales bacterium]HAA23760.1 hypothetical protein [Cytophagales bacterium]HAP62241.1 hypothetical protein [Cytophagales bacterium]